MPEALDYSASITSAPEGLLTGPNGKQWFTETDRGQGLMLEVSEHLYHTRTAYQTIDIYETPAYGRLLLLDGLVMTTDKDEHIYHELIAHVPMFIHPEPKRVLVIGGGDGGTVREVLRHPCIHQVVLCEIDGEVIDTCRRYFPNHTSALDDTRLDIRVQDAVAYVKEQAENDIENQKFDMVLIDSTDPIGPGEGLFSPEFYANLMAVLTPGGIIVGQTGSPFDPTAAFQKSQGRLKDAGFKTVRPYFGVVPTYPRALWSWTLASPDNDIVPLGDDLRAIPLHRPETAKPMPLKYWTPAIHQGCFAAPAFTH